MPGAIDLSRFVRTMTIVLVGMLVAGCIASPPLAGVAPTCRLPPPPGADLGEFDARLRAFVQNGCYLDWDRDAARRDASEVHGGWVINYYSPPVGTWLRAGRPGSLSDGSLIVKEMWADAGCRSLPPYYLADRFAIFDGCPDPLAPGCYPETKRLLYLTANLDTGVTIHGQQPIANWKLELVSAGAQVR